MKLLPLRRTANRIFSFYWGSGLCDDVPALAWYLVGVTVPLTLGIAAIAALVLGDGAEAEEVATKLAKVLPPSARDQVIEGELPNSEQPATRRAGARPDATPIPPALRADL